MYISKLYIIVILLTHGWLSLASFMSVQLDFFCWPRMLPEDAFVQQAGIRLGGASLDLMPSWHAIWTYFLCPDVILYEQVAIRVQTVLHAIYKFAGLMKQEKNPVFFPKTVPWPLYVEQLHIWAISGGHCVFTLSPNLADTPVAYSLKFRAYCMFATFIQRNILLTQTVAYFLLGAASAALLGCRGRRFNDV